MYTRDRSLGTIAIAQYYALASLASTALGLVSGTQRQSVHTSVMLSSHPASHRICNLLGRADMLQIVPPK